MNKLKVLGASVAMALLVASPAAAQNGGFNVESQFFGTDTVQFGGAGNGFDNDFDNDFDEDVFGN
jgi:hypothetical protein